MYQNPLTRPINERGEIMIDPTIVRRVSAWLLIAALAVGCDDDDPSGPEPFTDIGVSVPALDLGEIDLNFGASVQQTVTVSNFGSGDLQIHSVSLTGTDAGEFGLESGGGAALLVAGASQDIVVFFDPASEGAKGATLLITSDDPDEPTVNINLTGTGSIFRFRQVDRMGIPALNTIFNHPPAFSKTAYNTAGPDGDLAAYTGLFETVLGAVANADPVATAALLLPDELPVSLGAVVSNFPELTGRKPADDGTDVALQVVVGITALQSDNVDENDVPFLTSFPYLAEPNN